MKAQRHSELVSGWKPFTPEESAAYTKSQIWSGTTTVEVLDRYARVLPNQVVLTDKSGAFTWKELSERSILAGRAFRASGIGNGDFVVLQLPNTADHYILYLGLNRIGAIPIMCLPRHRKIEIAHQIKTHEAKAIVTIGDGKTDNIDFVDELRQEMPYLKLLLCTGHTHRPGWMPLDEFYELGKGADSSSEEAFKPDPNDLCMEQLSGGTTGVSKGIPHTHNFHIALWEHWGRGLGFTDESTFFCLTPVGHQASCAFSGSAFHRGGRIVLSESSDPEETLRLIEKHRVTHTLLFPVQVNRILSYPARSKYDLSSLKVVIYGGQKITPELIKRTARELNTNVAHVFGMTEGPAIFGRWDAPIESQMHTVGWPMFQGPEWTVRLVDDNNNDVAEGEVGELVAKGAFTIRGYFRAPEANEKSFDESGFFHTGDLMLRRPDGRYVVIGRKTDMIIRAGENVYPGPIESALTRHPHVRNAAVVGIPHADLGESLCAFVECGAGGTLTLKAMQEFLKSEGMAVFQFPESMFVVEAWPWTSAGKIDKAVLRAFSVRHLLEAGRITMGLADDYLRKDKLAVGGVDSAITKSNLKVVGP